MNLGIVGAGYVGLTTGICLASVGHKIIVYEVDGEKIQKLREGKLPFYEPDLDQLLEKVRLSENLQLSNSVKELVLNTEGCFVCVGTPSSPSDKSIDLSQITEAIRSLANVIKELRKNDYVIIIRSTVVPKTSRENIIPLLKEVLASEKFSLCVVPEFLREGQALSDFMNPDKIVIGSVDKRGELFVKNVFEYFKEKAVFIPTNLETAEMIKYTNNAFFSTLISFANEIANICEKIGGVDAFQVINALIADKRITTKINGDDIIPYLTTYLLPGCGFGGSCFPKDVHALTQHARSVGAQTPLLESVLRINDERPKKIVSLAESLLGDLKNKQISVLGLAFKPDTDDIRSSPSVEAIKLLETKGAKLSAYDPKVNRESIQKADIGNVLFHSSLENCLKNSSLVILFTKWKEFERIDGSLLAKYMNNPLIIDGRGFLDSQKFHKNTYFKVGYKERTIREP